MNKEQEIQDIINKLKLVFPTTTFVAIFDENINFWKVGVSDYKLYFESKKFKTLKDIYTRNFEGKILFFHQTEEHLKAAFNNKKWGNKNLHQVLIAS